MNWFPLRTYRLRRREYGRWVVELERLLAEQTAVNQHRFLFKERGGTLKSISSNAGSIRAAAKREMGELEQGLLKPFNANRSEALLSEWQDLLESDRQDRAQLEAHHAQAADAATRAGLLAYDEARALQNNFHELVRKFANARKQTSKTQTVVFAYANLTSFLGKLKRLEHLVLESAEPLKPLEHIALLPLRENEENSSRLELLEKLATAVQTARATGKARPLRESWMEEQRLFSELRYDSEIWVRRAEREINSWLSHSDLHPALTQDWAQRWQQLLQRSQSPSFLAEWDAAKLELAKHVRASFEEHWNGITTRSRKLRFAAELTWSEVEQVAEQVRRGSMPYLYQEP